MYFYKKKSKSRKNRVDKYSFGIVKSMFNVDLTDKLYNNVKTVLKKNNIKYSSYEVPGAMEIPLASQWVFEHREYDAVIALGVVIRGETSHYDSVCRALENGCIQVQLKHGKPIIFGVLTVENKQQALDRIEGEKGNRGEDIAKAAIHMRHLSSKLHSLNVGSLL